MNTQKTTVSVLLAFLLAGLLLAGCRGGDKQAGPPAGGPPEVEVVTLAPESVSLSEELPGRTTAFRIAEVRPQVSGIILKRHFEEGTEVKAGQLLYKIDPAVCQAAYQLKLPCVQIIHEFGQWTHLAVAFSNERTQLLTAKLNQGKTIYELGLVHV